MGYLEKHTPLRKRNIKKHKKKKQQNNKLQSTREEWRAGGTLEDTRMSQRTKPRRDKTFFLLTYISSHDVLKYSIPMIIIAVQPTEPSRLEIQHVPFVACYKLLHSSKCKVDIMPQKYVLSSYPSIPSSFFIVLFTPSPVNNNATTQPSNPTTHMRPHSPPANAFANRCTWNVWSVGMLRSLMNPVSRSVHLRKALASPAKSCSARMRSPCQSLQGTALFIT